MRIPKKRRLPEFLAVFLLITVCTSVAGADKVIPTRTLLFGGDVMLGNWVIDHLERDGMDYPFRAVQSILQQADVRFYNLEAPIGTADSLYRSEKTYTFAFPPKYREALKYSGAEVVSLANNHILDYGQMLADSTVHFLQEMGIHGVGYGSDIAAASQPFIHSEDFTIGFLAYSMTFPRSFWATDTSAGTAYPQEEYFTNRVTYTDSIADFTVVSFHWGSENSDSTKKYQQVYAHRAIDAGADVIVGHHPHIWQGLEAYKGRLIAYSLGNYCFGSFSPVALESGLLEVQVTVDSILAARIHPLNVKNVDVRFQPQPMEPTQAGTFFQHVETISARFDSTSYVKIRDNGIVDWKGMP